MSEAFSSLASTGDLAVPGVAHTLIVDGVTHPVYVVLSCLCDVCLSEQARQPITGHTNYAQGYFRTGESFTHASLSDFQPPLRTEAAEVTGASVEQVGQLRAERDQLAARLAELRRTIGEVAFHYCDDQGWDTYGEPVEKIVRAIGGEWPEKKRVGFTVTATFEVIADYFGAGMPDISDPDTIIDGDELRSGLRLVGINDELDSTRAWHYCDVQGLPGLTIANLRPIQS